MGACKNIGSIFAKCLLALCAIGNFDASHAAPDPAATLRDKFSGLGEQLRRNPFGRPLVIESTDVSNHLKGEIYATVEYPFGEVSGGLSNPAHWCDVISLHINTKYCRAATAPSGTTLEVRIGKKTAQEVADAARVDFDYEVLAASADYFDITLNARNGPMGTSDYRIELEAVALPKARTFIHLTYSYAFNFAGRLAMQTYLNTLARDKVGFTAAGKRGDGQTEYVGGMRGLVERNAMRYYLAINSFLESASSAPAAQFERRLQSWFAATEQYPRQLHEVDRTDYLEMKRAENARQQSAH
jgi:hypothetical protein